MLLTLRKLEAFASARLPGFFPLLHSRIATKQTFLFQDLDKHPAIGAIAFGTQGVKTGDDDHFVKKFWELPDLISPWRPYLGT